MDIAQVLLFWLFMTESRSKISPKKERNQYLAILTEERLVNKGFIIRFSKKKNSRDQAGSPVIAPSWPLTHTNIS